jgi:hypothetical protein
MINEVFEFDKLFNVQNLAMFDKDDIDHFRKLVVN